jgi:3-hydroxyisobutyrate dehydrogenase
MHIGFVSTGNMGRPMAKNILKAGHQMTVFDLLPDARAVEAALWGPAGLMEGARSGDVVF